jgi:hypothetical protein
MSGRKIECGSRKIMGFLGRISIVDTSKPACGHTLTLSFRQQGSGFLGYSRFFGSHAKQSPRMSHDTIPALNLYYLLCLKGEYRSNCWTVRISLSLTWIGSRDMYLFPRIELKVIMPRQLYVSVNYLLHRVLIT